MPTIRTRDKMQFYGKDCAKDGWLNTTEITRRG